MKFLVAALFAVGAGSAQASYYATHCSNATGTVRWEEGHNSNTLFLREVSPEEVVSVPVHKVQMKFTGQNTISESNVRNCGFASTTKIYSAKVQITPAKEHPEALDFLDGEKLIKATVICQYEMNGRAPCP